MRKSIAGVVVALGLLIAAAARGVDLPGVDAPHDQGGDAQTPVLLLADEVTYDRELGIAVARGNVEVSQGGRVLRADTLTYNERVRTVSASGNVALMEPSGEVTFAEFAELTDDLKEGVVKNVGLLLSDHVSRAAAVSAVRTQGNRTVMNKAVFSPCDLCPDDPTAAPIWQLKAVKVIHDQQEKTIEYQDAFMEIYGVPVFYTPWLSHPDPTVQRKSGFLMPSVGRSTEYGWLGETPYFWAISDDKDLTVTPRFLQHQSAIQLRPGVLLSGEYRQRFRDGYMRLQGSATVADRQKDGSSEIEDDALRGHIDGVGRFDVDDHWRWGFDAERASDKTYLRSYKISSTSVLTSRAYTEGFYGRSYVSAQSLAFQGLRSIDDDGQEPFIAPEATLSYVGEPDHFGGYFNADGGLLNLMRTEGRDSHRLHARGGYHLPYTAPAGDIYTLDASVTADGYFVDDVDPNSDDVDPSSDVNTFSGFTGRLMPQVYGEWRYPFVRRHARASELFEPIVGLALATTGANSGKIPNEDSADFEFDETHLFDPDRFAGLDRVDSGGRLDYGAKWSLLGDSGGYTSVLLGQSLRLYGDNDFPSNSGLQDTLSDVVGRIEIQPRYDLNLGYRFRYDLHEMNFERNEVTLTAGPQLINLGLTYAFAASDSEADFNSTEQVTATLRTRLSDYWAASAAARYDLGSNQPLSEAVSVAYSDECFTLRLSASHTYYRDGQELQPETSFLLTIGFKYLGTYGVPITGLLGTGQQQ